MGVFVIPTITKNQLRMQNLWLFGYAKATACYSVVNFKSLKLPVIILFGTKQAFVCFGHMQITVNFIRLAWLFYTCLNIIVTSQMSYP